MNSVTDHDIGDPPSGDSGQGQQQDFSKGKQMARLMTGTNHSRETVAAAGRPHPLERIPTDMKNHCLRLSERFVRTPGAHDSTPPVNLLTELHFNRSIDSYALCGMDMDP